MYTTEKRKKKPFQTYIYGNNNYVHSSVQQKYFFFSSNSHINPRDDSQGRLTRYNLRQVILRVREQLKNEKTNETQIPDRIIIVHRLLVNYFSIARTDSPFSIFTTNVII